MISFTVLNTDAGSRLDRFLTLKATEFTPPLSRSQIQKLIQLKAVEITRHGQKLASVKPKEPLRTDDEVTIDQKQIESLGAALQSEKNWVPKAQEISLEVLYEDHDLLIINKQAGIVTHPAPGNRENTLVNALLHYTSNKLSQRGGSARAGIVHRLDKDTSGCLAIAKTDFAHQSLSSQFAKRTVEKIYLAIVRGHCPENAKQSGMIEVPIGRHPVARQKMCVFTPNKREAAKTRNAQTEYRFLQTLPSLPGNSPISLVQCRLLTGRTHQIRVHLQHLGYPILGDMLYGGSAASLAPRQMLHAWKLTIYHPRTGEPIVCTAPLPKDFLEFDSKLESVWTTS